MFQKFLTGFKFVLCYVVYYVVYFPTWWLKILRLDFLKLFLNAYNYEIECVNLLLHKHENQLCTIAIFRESNKSTLL